MNIWDWSQPLGLGAFILGMALVVFVLCMALKTLATIPASTDRRKR